MTAKSTRDFLLEWVREAKSVAIPDERTNAGMKQLWFITVTEKLADAVKDFELTTWQQVLIAEGILVFCDATSDAAMRRKETVSLLELASQINSFAP